jgi:hypothetical protein
MYWHADDILAPNRLPVQLVFEIRLPATFKIPPQRRQMTIELRTDRNIMPVTLSGDSPRRAGDALVLEGEVDLYFRTANRLLAVNFPNEPELVFRLPLRSNPYEPQTMSNWKSADIVGDAGSAQAGRAPNADQYQIRYRVDRRGAP